MNHTPEFRPPEPHPPERKPRRVDGNPRRFFLDVRGRRRGAEVQVIRKATTPGKVVVRVLDTGEEILVARSAVSATMPDAPDARIVRGGLPGQGRR